MAPRCSLRAAPICSNYKHLQQSPRREDRETAVPRTAEVTGQELMHLPRTEERSQNIIILSVCACSHTKIP